MNITDRPRHPYQSICNPPWVSVLADRTCIIIHHTPEKQSMDIYDYDTCEIIRSFPAQPLDALLEEHFDIKFTVRRRQLHCTAYVYDVFEKNSHEKRAATTDIYQTMEYAVRVARSIFI